MIEQHPDFQAEKQRLEETTNYMQQLLIRSQRDIEAARSNIRNASSNLEYLDSSDSFINILTNTRFFDIAATQTETLQAILKRPYFARIDFQRNGEKRELLYIGKTSLFDSETYEPILIDWRAPVANVYYDGRLGDLTYDVRGEENSGHLFAKRQYKIEDGELLHFRDVDLTTNDELLQDALEGKADVRLTEIVSTIQKEQNEIIRAHLRQPILVQGAAGSGKTTIALHRISYFLYTLGEHFKPEHLMILAPNKLFIDYIGDVLPELGVDRIQQTTYVEYVLAATNLKLKLQNPNDLLEQIIEEGSDSLPAFNIPQIKGSKLYMDIMDRAVKLHEQKIASLFEDVFIEKFRILRGSHLQKLFLLEFAYMPIEKRLQRIKLVIQTEVKRKAKAILHTLNERYEETIGRALNGVFDEEKRRRLVVKYIDERDERLPKITVEARKTTTAYMRRFEKLNIKNYYREIVSNEALLNELVPEWSLQQVSMFARQHEKAIWVLEDLAALYYLHARLKGIDDKWKMRVVFIDEVQDYSYFQLAALKAGLETDMFTMVGDLAQGIHSYRSLTSWEPVLELFPRATYATLQKSYRTTIEIMEVANEILLQMDEELPLVEPVVRHGNTPTFIKTETFNAAIITDIFNKLKGAGHRSIAVICKTTHEAKRIVEALCDTEAQLLDEQSGIDQTKLLIVPSHLAKGLEFDAVIAVIYDDPFYDHPIDRKLLYVALTRPMHELYLVGPSRAAFLLSN